MWMYECATRTEKFDSRVRIATESIAFTYGQILSERYKSDFSPSFRSAMGKIAEKTVFLAVVCNQFTRRTILNSSRIFAYNIQLMKVSWRSQWLYDLVFCRSWLVGLTYIVLLNQVKTGLTMYFTGNDELSVVTVFSLQIMTLYISIYF